MFFTGSETSKKLVSVKIQKKLMNVEAKKIEFKNANPNLNTASFLAKINFLNFRITI